MTDPNQPPLGDSMDVAQRPPSNEGNAAPPSTGSQGGNSPSPEDSTSSSEDIQPPMGPGKGTVG